MRVGRHDRLQAEIKVEYRTPDVLARAISYELDVWLLVPGVLGIGPSQTTPESFYGDMRVYSRLITPTITVPEMMRPEGEGSPLTALTVLAAVPEKTKAWRRDVRRESRLAPRMFRSAARRLLAAMPTGNSPADRKRAVAALTELADAAEALGPRFRKLLETLRDQPLDPPTAMCLEACDEYLSIQLEVLATRGVAVLDRHSQDGDLRSRLVGVARREQVLRRERGWRSLIPENAADIAQREAFLDQIGLLKRYVEKVLHLRTEATRRHTMARNAILGVAAALAMTWAVGLQVFALYAYGLEISQKGGTHLVIGFCTVAIFGYILKDRIKAWSAEVLARQLPRFMDDRGFALTWGIFATRLGRASERLRWLGSDELEPAVRQRHIDATRSELAAAVHDDVLHYRRRVVLHPRAALVEFPRFCGAHDIVRINVARWVRTLAAPRRRIAVLDAKDKPGVRKLPNRYGVPVVTRLVVRQAGSPQRTEWSVQRLLLDQRGIVRVEALDPSTEAPALVPGNFV